jgi:hypothetical protein
MFNFSFIINGMVRELECDPLIGVHVLVERACHGSRLEIYHMKGVLPSIYSAFNSSTLKSMVVSPSTAF